MAFVPYAPFEERRGECAAAAVPFATYDVSRGQRYPARVMPSTGIPPDGSLVWWDEKHTRFLRLREFVWVVASSPRRRGPHRPGSVDLTARRRRRSVHRSARMASRRRFGAFVYTIATRGSRERPWGQRSVHRSAETAPRHSFGAFVYTIATRAASGGTSASTAMVRPRRPLGGRLSLGRENRLCVSAAASLASSPR